MASFDSSEHPHRRRNALTGEWVLVSPHRADRPWQSQTEDPPEDERPRYDPDCYLCPGNDRSGDATNPDYSDTFVSTNDFSALKLGTPEGTWSPNGDAPKAINFADIPRAKDPVYNVAAFGILGITAALYVLFW